MVKQPVASETICVSYICFGFLRLRESLEILDHEIGVLNENNYFKIPIWLN